MNVTSQRTDAGGGDEDAEWLWWVLVLLLIALTFIVGFAAGRAL